MAKYNFWSFCQDGVAMLFAVPTYGASMVLSPTARSLAKNIIGSGSEGNSNSQLEQSLKVFEMQSKEWQAMVKARQEEIERLRKEKDEDLKKLKFNNEEITRLQAVLNNPHSSEAEKDSAKKRIVVLEGENEEIKTKLDGINKKLDGLNKPLPPPTKPWTFPKLDLIDKLLITSGVVLIVYLIIPDKKR